MAFLVEERFDDRIAALLDHPDRWGSHVTDVLSYGQGKDVLIVESVDWVEEISSFEQFQGLLRVSEFLKRSFTKMCSP